MGLYIRFFIYFDVLQERNAVAKLYNKLGVYL
jgi:hypothetical protein